MRGASRRPRLPTGSGRRPTRRPGSYASPARRSRPSSTVSRASTSTKRAADANGRARSSLGTGPMLVKITSAALHGIEAYAVEVEVDIAAGFPTFVTVGLPDAAVRESKERVRAALKNCGYDLESKRITINLAPADRRKEGSAFDLPIALGFLAFLEVVPAARLRDYLFVGELALDGRLKPVRGALPIALMARRTGFAGLVVPGANAREAALVRGLEVYALEDLVRVVRLLREPGQVAPCRFD